MNKYIATAFAGAMLLAAPAWAEEESNSGSDADAKIKKYIEMGPGVVTYKTDENNTLRSCLIVGQARISKVFGAAKGKLDAKKKAKLNAEAEFVGWLKKNVSAMSQDGEMTVSVMEGSEENGESETRESGVSTNTTSHITTTQAQGQLRGMRLLAADQNDEYMSMVYAWKPEYAAAAAGAAGAMNTKDAAPGQAAPTGIDAPAGSVAGAAGATGGASSGSGKSKIKIESKTTIADDADEFL